MHLKQVMSPFACISDANLLWKHEKSTWLKTMCIKKTMQARLTPRFDSICGFPLIWAPFNEYFPAKYILYRYRYMHDGNRLCQCTLRFVSLFSLLNCDVFSSFCVVGWRVGSLFTTPAYGHTQTQLHKNTSRNFHLLLLCCRLLFLFHVWWSFS